MTTRDAWLGEEWQAHCMRLLVMKFGEDVQPVPDRVQGDGAMEAYRLDDRVVYQCYSPEDALTVAAQTAAQKKKMYEDTKALTDHLERTQRILGVDYKVRRWVLLTPEYDDKALIIYARELSEKIRSAAPAWCCTTFEIVVHNDTEYFAAELAKIQGAYTSIRLTVPEPDQAEVLAVLNAGVADAVRNKLRVDEQLKSQPQDLEEYLHETLMDFVYGNRQLNELESRYAITFESVERESRQVFRAMRRILQATDGGPSGVNALTDRLMSALEGTPGLSSVTREQLARFYVAKWWVDCPLRFREPV